MERSEANRLLCAGRQMSPDEAGAAEARVEVAALIDDRITLVGYYWSQSCAGDHFTESWCRHVLDLIRRDPSAEFLRAPFFTFPASRSRNTLVSVRDEWLKQMELHSNSLQVLGNAANFFTQFDPPLADRLFRRACQLDGDEGPWAFRRSLLLSSQIKGGLTDHNFIRTRITELERTRFEPTDEKGRSYLFGELANCAFSAGMRRDAVRLARMSVGAALRSRGSHGFHDPWHAANILLGRLAMRSEDSQQAARHL